MQSKLIIAMLFAASVSTAALADDFGVVPMNSTTEAGNTTVTNTYGGMNVAPNTTVGVGSTTIYNQPGMGGNGPVQGTQRGSTSDTSYGAAIRLTF